ncbi:D-2-hydroxyacid dehydrogenase [Clostridium sp. 19966]|uniref:NAD(P)-dependent oxidoreductase n=1 Tax=Clostridium sp. 19966 TaxID=2768166 RepID=UPI0028DE4B23|nr:NAD(P)-dependent oxidoreductase [Clostridium sp. 19966]MDT8717960.1 D-2-hydroxyacid dehydrogenase [Clostridium sp. 19966]
MKIVIFEVKLLGSEDESWERLKSLPNVEFVEKYVDVDEEEIVEKGEDADMIICNIGNYHNGLLSKLPNLKYLGLMTTGYNQVDLEEAAKNNIAVTNIPAYGTMSVAQHVMALLLEITSKVGLYSEAVKRIYWKEESQFMFRVGKQFELAGKTMGIFGLGNIGYAVANMAKGFGMNIIAYTKHRNPNFQDEFIEYVDMETLWTRADVISLNASLSKETTKIINDETIAKMKDGVIILNAARGQMIDEEALARGIYSGKIYAAGLDTLEQEPPKPNNPLLGLPQCIITPHMAWSTKEARERIVNISIDNAISYLNGNSINVVKL